MIPISVALSGGARRGLSLAHPHRRRLLSSQPMLPSAKPAAERSARRRGMLLCLAAAGVSGAASGVESSASPTKGRFAINTSSTADWSTRTLCEGDVESRESQTGGFPKGAVEFDHYNGVIVHLDKLPSNCMADLDRQHTSIEQAVKSALTAWTRQGRKGIWMHVPPKHSHWIPILTKEGFDFHSVKSGVGHHGVLILTKWLDTDTENRLPQGPNHQVGIGAVVLKPDDPSQMLVVQERTGPAAAYGLWKMPTGLLDPSEDVPIAASRELLEETGLEAESVGIVVFRQAHSPHRPSDIFFVCLMKLKSASNNPEFNPCEKEIAAIRWMPVEEYCAQQRWQGSPVYEALNGTILNVSKRVLENQNQPEKWGLIQHEILPLGFASTTNAVYKSQL